MEISNEEKNILNKVIYYINGCINDISKIELINTLTLIQVNICYDLNGNIYKEKISLNKFIDNLIDKICVLTDESFSFLMSRIPF